MIKKLSSIIVLIFLMTSCAEVGFTRLSTDGYFNSKLSVENVQVFLFEKDVPGEFIKLGVVTVRGWQANEEWIIYKLKEKAQTEGGNASLLKRMDPKGLFTYSYGTGEAIAIKIKK